MKKILKISLFSFSLVLLLIIIIFFFWITSSRHNRKNKEKELIEYSKLCDSVQIIKEQPEISFSGFNEMEIQTLKFQIYRNGEIIKDSVIKNNYNYISSDKKYLTTKIPFIEFLKKDTIVITTNNKLKFYISDFHHSAQLLYGMFGPVAISDCSLNNNFNINGSYTNNITKEIALIESERNNRIRIINAMDEEIETLSRNSKITKEIAEKIFDSNKINEHWISNIFCGIHIEKTGNYYIFKEEREDKNGKMDIIKINAETGNYQRFTNYPFN